MSDEVRYILYDRYGIRIDETTDKRELRKWLEEGAEVSGVKVAKYPTLDDPSLFVVVELQNRRLINRLFYSLIKGEGWLAKRARGEA